MPLYDYRCAACGHTYEVRHSISADTPACPSCGASNPTRLITKMPAVAQGMTANAGDGRSASKEQLRDKWAEETPKLRKKLVNKFGEDYVNRNAPSLNQTPASDAAPKKSTD